MSNFSHNEVPYPQGATIVGYNVLGGDIDNGAGTEADVAVRVNPVGQFVCTVVTRKHFANTAVQASGFGELTPAMFDGAPGLATPPFVVNDNALTPTVLDRVFTGEVGPDLASSLAPVHNLEA